MKKVIYICDRKKPCNTSPSCGHLCTHTADPAHARYGVTFDAENDSRFEEDNRYWWEKEVSDDGRNESTDQGDGQGNS